MLQKITRQVGSCKKKFDVTIGFDGMAVEQIQQDAMSYYVWAVQRTIRDATEPQREKWEIDGIIVHATEVGKPFVSPEELVDKMSDDTKLEVLALLEKKVGK